MSEWFGTWFDSPYYHILYKDRDYTEAELFVTNLIKYLQPSKDSIFHDIACGKGRHSVFLNKMGYHVEGSDYSQNSIAFAKQFENDSLRFFVHDMREPIPHSYDYILNMFTSFGYFDSKEENRQPLRNIYNALNPNGRFVFDFMNVDFVLQNLVPSNEVSKGGIDFSITRKVEKQKLVKRISFNDNGTKYNFTEEVATLRPSVVKQMMKDCGFHIIEEFGSYALEPFDLNHSNRLILVLKK